jgi:hypothetical protein
MRTLALLLVLCSTAFAAPPVVRLPSEVKGDVGSFIAVSAECDAPSVAFYAIDAGINLFPPRLLADPKTTVVTSAKAGRYRILAYSGNGDGPSEPVVVTVVVGNAPPVVVTPDTPEPDKPAPDPTTKATAVVYVYEKDDGGVPSAVLAGLNRVNREQKIRATLFEDDSVDGTGDVPEQYKTPLAEARKVGLPALVVMAGESVLLVVKAPTTEAAVVEAAR